MEHRNSSAVDIGQYDVIVVGGGHAGVEAASVAARRGASVAVVTFDPSKIGAMSCNPAIGGLGKGHLVREVDAFGGLMACAADAAAIHYRMLNRSKGSAVHGPRVQADRVHYAAAIQRAIATEPGISCIEGEASELFFNAGVLSGLILADGRRLFGRSVVLATGTFLGGRLFRGEWRAQGGRIEERAASRLGIQLRELGLPLSRLKTGTPPRLDGRTIDWAALEVQPSDAELWTMSPSSEGRVLPQLYCGVTRTNANTHDIIRAAADRSPIFSGAIGAAGPRYCPSIEDKVVRFGDRDGHQIFLEPEGLATPLVYPNGISTSLPDDVQRDMIRKIAGLEVAEVIVPGYAVEYDHIDPRALTPELAVADIAGLFCAGQINGTTGYEEAAGQGLVAGINAAAHAIGIDSWEPDRRDSYLGVMIDDLVHQGITEPYRMLTARAEYRLRLRINNAETRLSPIAARLGCLNAERLVRLERRREARDRLESELAASLSASVLRARGAEVPLDAGSMPAKAWLRFPAVQIEHLLVQRNDHDADVLAEAAEEGRYAPYLARQDAEVRALHANDMIALPANFDFAAVPGLSAEMIERLSKARPATLGAASRIRGITPAALSAILLHSRRLAA